MITQDILIDFVKGKKYAFDKIYQLYSGAMYGICLRYTRCADDAQDVLQEGFIKVHIHKNQYEVAKPFGAWIKTIMIHEALNYIKKNYKFVLVENETDFDQIQEIETNTTDKDDLKKKLLYVLNKLPDGYRTIFNLYTIDNLTHKEIAEYLNISEGTSKSQYFKAKKMIQNILESEKIER
ncbi:MAG: sigma-70 family RNA polymerase sigma factor [Flavobacteriia bacterium]|nr:sigma-70 family RNA polymerase sigma factor [Flavobacteriia bacterium]